MQLEWIIDRDDITRVKVSHVRHMDVFPIRPGYFLCGERPCRL